MIRNHALGATIAAGLLSLALAAGCGGGGGSTLPKPGGGSHSPGPSPTPALMSGLDVATSGTGVHDAVYGPAGNANVIFSCGCDAQAGFGRTDALGNMTLVANSTPTPAAPNPIYNIVGGRNYVEVGTTTGGAEAWNIQFAGKTPSTNISLETSNRSDAYTAAASLFVYYNSPTGVTAYDRWNFYTIAGWMTTLKSAPNSAEAKLLDDIVTETVANHTLFPTSPAWNPGQSTNPTIVNDLKAVKAGVDSTKPTPCPSTGCTGTPTP